MMPSLIATLHLHPEHQLFFDKLRDAHFPAHANYLQAHITLFHHLPSNEPLIREQLLKFSKHQPISLLVQDISCFRNGVAYSLVSEELQQLHLTMQEAFMPWLKKRDQQKLWPHITIQNKVTAFKAQMLFEKLKEDFTQFEIKATGINTWLYLKGPWKLMDTLPFENE
ncbi:2'-5' RNA ligase superfamily protein [Chitinophaga sp. CF118]|uniref:2'-5' RNA ligase family protein n=1 Tax=Chitinophaga sp. CF118 TaxID=1884367 RepID=UPI0008EA5946|nr:2'-5' RNA ligase family protein [Chitinophaga sp. CF118]SFE43940.1 2'-5' RNA ligase superfamily protein [Chitinophaga sp. CF118]